MKGLHCCSGFEIIMMANVHAIKKEAPDIMTCIVCIQDITEPTAFPITGIYSLVPRVRARD